MMLESISLGDISIAVTFLVGLIGGIGYLHNSLKKWITEVMKEQMEKFDSDIKDINDRLDKVDLQSCKNFLVRCIADFENGQQISETELERFYEQYEYYEKHGGNSYIKQKVEKLKAKGII